MRLVIEKEEYDLPYGISLLKTLHGDDYNTIWTSGGTEKVLSSVKVFLTIDEQRWNNYK